MKRIILTLVLSFLSIGSTANPASTIWSWGEDNYNQISNTPTGTGFTAVAAGLSYSHALDASGTIHSWGDNTNGKVSSTPPGTGFTAISAGNYHSHALDASGTIHSWGQNYYDQVSNTPPGTGFTAVAAGGQGISVALDASGTIHSWGTQNNNVSNAPTGTGFTAIAAGGNHILALDASGTIHGWGNDYYGNVTNIPPGTGFTAISAGHYHSHALDANGTIHSWGRDSAPVNSEISFITGVVSNTPPGQGFTAIAAGNDYSIALRSDGTMHGWGSDSDGLISNTPSWGYNEDGQVYNTLPGTFFTAIAAGQNHSLALRGSPPNAVINIYNSVLHPRHDGSGSNQDDVIPVIVHGSSTPVGNLAYLDTNDIDVESLRFGPGMGSMNLSSTGQSWFNFDVNGDGLDDALFHFQMSAAAFDKVTCSDNTGTLVGELSTGEAFTGIDFFFSDCNASCH
jgi:alpha-tubulin suppressor-like RCC1 family protein